MKTKNIYSYPVDEKDIKKIFIKESPAHIKYTSKIHNEVYDLRNAVDFLCDEDIPIRAALEGKVVTIQDGITKNWDKHKAPPEEIMKEDEQDGNFVVLKHTNNEFSIYSHLQSGRIQVKKGQEVKTGQVLGYCGNTGWSIKPHLHFMVFKFTKPKPAGDFESLEIKFRLK